MNYLVDTHALLWFLSGSVKLPKKTRDTIKNLDNNCYVSIASIWEIAIKLSLKKLQLDIEFTRLSKVLSDNKIDILPLTFEHLVHLSALKFNHRDPFDRAIVCQSIAEKLTVITSDENIKSYPVKTFWR